MVKQNSKRHLLQPLLLITYRDWELLEKYSGFEFNDAAPKGEARTQYENMMYLERPGCNLCMGNQEKAEKS